MTEELVTYETQQVAIWRPIMSIQDVVDRYQMMARVVEKAMRSGYDYGVIVTGTKPTLLKPGAEKLCKFFGLRLGDPPYEIIEQEEDWTGQNHNGEPFFYYLVRCRLYSGDVMVGGSDGSCNSWEKKYRYRQAERKCPRCGRAAIIKGKAEYGGGWLCFSKRHGCGAKFPDGDEAIEAQVVGQVLNVDIYDQVNTILKMAEKRAYVGAVLNAVGASEFFTQDMEDIIDGEWEEAVPVATEAPSAATTRNATDNSGSGAAKRRKGGRERPLSSVQLIEAINLKAGEYRKTSESWMGPPPEGLVGAMVGKLNEILGDDLRRHSFLYLVTGKTTSKALDHAQVRAIMDWMGKDEDMARDEGNRLINEQVQQQAVGELFDLSQEKRQNGPPE